MRFDILPFSRDTRAEFSIPVMKLPAIFLIALLGSIAQAQDAAPVSPDQPPPAPPQLEVEASTAEAKAAQEAFSKLKAEDQEKFFKLLNEGEKLMGERRVPEALQKFNDAEAYWAIHPNLLNLKGAALVNIRDFERATGYFETGSRVYPAFWQSRFNLAEMNFVRKKWVEAETQFKDLLEKEKQLDVGTRKLLDYKVILSLIKQKKFDEAEKMIKKYDSFDDSPIFFYATAARHFEKDERKQAEEWVTNARAVYDPAINAIFEDSLSELGWLFVF